MSYDIKFKQRAVEYQREGHTYKETCKVFKISETTLTRWINKEKEGKLGEVKIQVRKPKKIYPEKLINPLCQLNFTIIKLQQIQYPKIITNLKEGYYSVGA